MREKHAQALLLPLHLVRPCQPRCGSVGGGGVGREFAHGRDDREVTKGHVMAWVC